MNDDQQHIAVMNDDAVYLDLMNDLLTDEGYRVTLIRESRKAYEIIKAEPPDLVILDIRMGNELTGFELIGLLLLDPVTRQVPLIVASADSQALPFNMPPESRIGNCSPRISSRAITVEAASVSSFAAAAMISAATTSPAARAPSTAIPSSAMARRPCGW